MIWLLILFLIVPIVYAVNVFNSLATARVRVREAWSHIDVQLKRRVDLIPNLVETVKAYASHEKQVFENVTKARSALMSAGGAKDAAQAENMLNSALKSLFAIAEAYPELKAQENFGKLQIELSDTEDKIAYARQFYNSTVQDLNTKIVTFPGNFFAGIFNFTEEQFFKADESEKGPVKVNF